jgi:ribosomal protein L14E/L6E/L27E
MIGNFVLSISGRDKGRVHAVVAQDVDRCLVYICDGKTRKVEKPKPKKLKHIKFLSNGEVGIKAAIAEGKLTNKMLQAAIARQEMTKE